MFNVEIGRLNGIISSINSMNLYFDNAIEKLNKASNEFDGNVIISGKTFDDGSLKECASSLTGMKTNLQTIKSYCSEKILCYQLEEARLEKLAQQESDESNSESDDFHTTRM